MENQPPFKEISSSPVRELIQNGCIGFYEVLSGLHTNPSFFDYFWNLNESSMRHFFMKGLMIKYGLDHFDMLTEISSSTSKSYGRIDLILDNRTDLYVFECKAYYSRETEPKSAYWKKDRTNKFFDETLKQATSYTEMEDYLKRRVKTFIALTFSRIVFNNPDNIQLWKTCEVGPEEFYMFRDFQTHHDNQPKQVGVAVYGKVAY